MINSIDVLLNNKTIDSKSQSSKLNFDANMKTFLSTLEINFNQCRLNQININLLKSGSKINIERGITYDVN